MKEKQKMKNQKLSFSFFDRFHSFVVRTRTLPHPCITLTDTLCVASFLLLHPFFVHDLHQCRVLPSSGDRTATEERGRSRERKKEQSYSAGYRQHSPHLASSARSCSLNDDTVVTRLRSDCDGDERSSTTTRKTAEASEHNREQ